MVYQILISTMYLHFTIFFLVFMIVGLGGEAVVIAEDFRPLIRPLFLSPDNIISKRKDNIGTVGCGPKFPPLDNRKKHTKNLRPETEKKGKINPTSLLWVTP